VAKYLCTSVQAGLALWSVNCAEALDFRVELDISRPYALVQERFISTSYRSSFLDIPVNSIKALSLD